MFLDLSKAYDCLNHNILLQKLDKYGIRERCLKWFESYLSKRQQMVQVEKDNKIARSNIQENNIGIPQGSILGPILFVIYINDFCDIRSQENQYIVNYADDSNLLVTAKLFDQLEREGNSLFISAKNYFTNAEMVLNIAKTSTILFKTRQSTIEAPADIILDTTQLNLAKCTKFLGIHINENLNWETHIDSLSIKLNKTCYAIRVISKYANLSTLKTLFFANFESVARFGILFWGSSQHMQKVFVTQKRVIRIVFKMNFNDSCRGVFRTNKIMTMYALYIYECLIFIFRNRNIFPPKTNYTYSTRTLNFNYPIHRLTLTEKGPEYMCMKFFNSLPEHVKRIDSLRLYKKELKKILIDIEPYNIDDYLHRS